ncbi:MAG: hypothetical protein FWE17_02925 [Alphaproteobacteria bacterium]|nr:hypothetical protein [Alphaproteobacteria bacterium]MCL2758347.1 hypothetical protein [Alphaproteobacteria bacterium]
MKINPARLFDWTIAEVKDPIEIAPFKYKNVMLAYYVVKTVYRHHGEWSTYFGDMCAAKTFCWDRRAKIIKAVADVQCDEFPTQVSPGKWIFHTINGSDSPVRHEFYSERAANAARNKMLRKSVAHSK